MQYKPRPFLPLTAKRSTAPDGGIRKGRLMNLNKKIFTITATVLTLWGISLPTLAQQAWSGTGQIVSGSGEGGLVELDLEIKDDQLNFLSGPEQNNQIQLDTSNGLNGTFNTDAGTWIFFESGNELEASFSQENPERIIRYELTPQ